MAGRPTILVVEDELAILQPLLRALDREGFDTVSACSVREAEAVLERGGLDLVVLDLGLPDGDGRDVCRRLGGALPVIILTARGTEVDRVVGLELGADDYVVKPFSSAELAARIRAVLRRAGTRADGAPPRPGRLEAGPLAVDPGTRKATAGGEPVELTKREFDLLHALVRRRGAVATRDELFDEVWEGPWYGSPKVLETQVAGLRRKLGPRHGDAIETVRGVGYRVRDEEP